MIHNDRSWALVLSLVICSTLHCNCNSQEITFENIDDPDDIFVKETPPTVAPNSINNLPTSTPTAWRIQYSPTNSPSISHAPVVPKIRLDGQDGCRIYRDIYCLRTTDKLVDVDGTLLNSTEVDVTQQLVGVSYQPFISAVEDWSVNATAEDVGSWTGYTVKAESELFDVNALAMGVVVTSISNIDTIMGTFDANLKIRLYDLTSDKKFQTIEDAFNTIYKKEESRTTLKDNKYYRYHNNDMPGAWTEEEIDDGEVVRPDGMCSSTVMTSMKPILAENAMKKFAFPHLNAKMWPDVREDEEGYLRYIDIQKVQFRYKPINREFYPVQIDLLDIIFGMGGIDLIDEDQKVTETLLCFHPAYSGFSTRVFGSDSEAGLETSDSLRLIPYLTFDRAEPWLSSSSDQFYYGKERQRATFGNGSGLHRKLGLRIIVEHPSSKGAYRMLPFLFISFAAVANFISSNPATMNGTTMIQALLGVNSLVTQDTQFMGTKSVLGHCLIIAYVINGLWVSTVVLMMLINHAKKDGEDKHTKWYILYQNKLFRYLRLLAASLCFLYIPLVLAYDIDKTNGEQSKKTWVWALTITFIVILFIIRAVKDIRIWRKTKRQSEDDSHMAIVFSSKPLNLWTQEDVRRWINIGVMDQESYFSRSKRTAIAEKLETACIYGKLLCELSSNVEKLVQFTELPYGDAVMLSDEVSALLRGSTWHQFVECGSGNGSPGTGDSPGTGGTGDELEGTLNTSVPVDEPSKGSNGGVEYVKAGSW